MTMLTKDDDSKTLVVFDNNNLSFIMVSEKVQKSPLAPGSTTRYGDIKLNIFFYASDFRECNLLLYMKIVKK
jgi:hypothetical protein